MKTTLTLGPWSCRSLYATNDNFSAIFWADTSKGGVHMRRLDDKGVFIHADAAFIVRACNAHDDLVSALEELLIDSAAHINVPIAEYIAGPLGRARAAIAKAKGG